MFADGGAELGDDPQPGTSADSPSKKSDFAASEGWTEKFRRRFNLASVSLHGYKGFSAEDIHHSAVDKAVRLEKLLGGEGFEDMTSDDGVELLEVYSKLLTDEDLAEMTKSASEEEKEQEEERAHEEEEEGLTLERLTTIFFSHQLRNGIHK